MDRIDYQILNILQNEEINEKIDIDNIYSNDKFIDKEICEFLFYNENKKVSNSGLKE